MAPPLPQRWEGHCAPELMLTAPVSSAAHVRSAAMKLAAVASLRGMLLVGLKPPEAV
jgi:hypothetical protein